MADVVRTIADYELIEELSDGNYGTFWRARTPARLAVDDDFVAVKVLHERGGVDAYARMVNELRVYKAVGSPYLLPIYDAGHESGTIFYAARYSTRGDLGRHRGSLTTRQRLAAVATAARAAHALHEAGVAHRDIKPPNILLFDDGAKLGDLGLAQILDPTQTNTGLGPLGSLAHQAPEMARGERAGRASDVFALGVTLHTALIGHTVFPALLGLGLVEALKFMLRPEVEVHPDLSPAAAAVIQRCAEYEPEDRYLTALELAEAIDELTVG